MAIDQEVPLEFPLAGIDVTGEFQLQPPGTTPEAVNVRSRDTLAGRARGGSRPGLVKYVAQQVPGWTADSPIQHLNVIVDPTTEALTQNFETPGTDWVAHPRFPGVLIPPGGGGNQPNPNAGQENPTLEVAVEQSYNEGFPLDSIEASSDFPGSVGTNRLLTVIVTTNETGAGNATVTVTNGAFDAYTQVSTYKRFTKVGQEFSLSVWRLKAENGPSDRVVKVTPSAAVTMVVAGIEWSGVNLSPIGNTNSNSGNAAAMTAGLVAASADDEAVVGCFLAGLAPDTVTPGAGYTLEVDHNDGTLDLTDIQLYVVYKLNLDLPNSSNPSATFAGGADDFAAIAFTIKD